MVRKKNNVNKAFFFFAIVFGLLFFYANSGAAPEGDDPLVNLKINRSSGSPLFNFPILPLFNTGGGGGSTVPPVDNTTTPDPITPDPITPDPIVFGSDIVFDNLGFSKAFDSGQIQSITQLSSNEYNFRLRMTPGDSWNSAWVNFMIKGAANRHITFNILDVSSVGAFVEDSNTPPKQMVYSCDGDTWSYMSLGSYNSITRHYTFDHLFECDVAQVATWFPYSYEDIQSFIHSKKSNNKVSVTTIGSSEQGRPIDVIEITNFDVADSVKKQVLIVARQHPSEPLSNHMIDGLINELLSNNKYTDKFHYYIVPAANPDSIVLGYSRRNYREVDTNRDWASPGTPVTAEIKAIKPFFQQVDNLYGVDFFIDWHSLAGGEPRTQLVSPRGSRMYAFYNLLRSKGDFAYSGGISYVSPTLSSCVQSSTSGSSAASFGCSLGPDVAFTYEVGQASPLWTISSLHEHGGYTAQAIYELYYG